MNKPGQGELGHHGVLREALAVLRERLCTRAAGMSGAGEEGKSAPGG